MADKLAKTSIFIDKYHPNKMGLCAVSIRVSFNRKRKFYITPISISVTDFKKIQGNKPRNNYKEISMKLQAYEQKAVDIIKSLPLFSWESFEKYYLSNRAANNTLNEAFLNYSQRLRELENISTAESYECAQKSLHNFAPSAKFVDVTVDFLNTYERWMIHKGKSITTVGIYLRSLRALFNSGIAEGILSKELYPFGKKKYEIPTGNNIKKSLTLNEISQIYYYKPRKGSFEEKARDYWLFMYLCNGINVKDMCLLKYENIKDDVIEFERAKTIRTKRKVEPIRVSLMEEIKLIIKNHGNCKVNGKTYIFKVLQPGLSIVRQRVLIKQFTRSINTHMRNIASELEIKSDVTTYAARHSFATILQRSGVSTEFISEALGHSNVITTQNYLAGFEDDSKKEISKALIAFKTHQPEAKKYVANLN